MIENCNEKYSASDKRKITRDWKELFPELKESKVLDLSNRVDPLVTGIYLKVVRGAVYTPMFYVHNLCRESSVITSTLNVSGRTIRPSEHNLKYKEIANDLKTKFYFPLEGNISIDKIIEGYERYFTNPNKATYTEFEDFALICGWTKQNDKIEYALKRVYEELSLWPEQRYFANIGFKNWFLDLEERVWDGKELHKILEKELNKHKLEKIPVRTLIY